MGEADPSPAAGVGHGVRWHVTSPGVRTLGAGLLFLLALLALTELTVRSRILAAHLPPPAWTSDQVVNAKLNRLEELVRERGRLDCLLIGGSGIERAINPNWFGDAYRRRRGFELISFNLGLRGLGHQHVGPVAAAILTRHNPALVILESGPLALQSRWGAGLARVLDHSPWFFFHRGDANVEGWLLEHSAAYRLYFAFRLVLAGRPVAEAHPTAWLGWLPIRPKVHNIRFPKFRDAKLLPSEANLAGLELAVRLIGPRRGAILELPTHPLYASAWQGGEAAFERARELIRSRGVLTGTPYYWLPDATVLIPPTGWHDNLHVNRVGAVPLSHWLGEAIAAAVEEGILVDPATWPATTR